MKNIFLYVIVGVIIISSVIFAVVYDATYDTDAKTASVNDNEKSNYVYVPSNITKANPRILQGGGGAVMLTTNIEELKDSIQYTIQGHVLGVGEPKKWILDNLGYCIIPVTMSVDKVYKGSIDSKIFTFYLQGMFGLKGKLTDMPVLSDYKDTVCSIPNEISPQVEIDEHIIVHLSRGGLFSLNYEGVIYDERDLDILLNSPYVVLGSYGKYKVYDNFGYNESYLTGKPISQIQVESTYDTDAKTASVNDNEKSNYVYVPSNITKANPRILVGHGDSFSVQTTNIAEVADDITYTIQGTILEIKDPIDWYERDDASSGHGEIPVTMSVENVYKGNLDSETFTFFLGSRIIYDIDNLLIATPLSEVSDKNKKYRFFAFEPQFEIGDKVLVHVFESYIDEKYLVESEDRDVLTPLYVIQLGKYGAYKIQNNVAYNEKFANGVSINHVIEESQP